ncbi:MAG TPA: Ig-like domain-containing protein, partial [Thermoplasmata archaeon]|nr:Ig-like domain-containing protein [Thermoplasmata archaeon]
NGGASSAPDLSGAPYPTVHFEPGYTTTKDRYSPWLLPIAAEGYVVIILEYDTSSAPDTSDITSVRVGHTISFLLAQNSSTSTSALKGMMDFSRFVATGHSMGGGDSVLDAGKHQEFDGFIPLAPYILSPLYKAPDMPGEVVKTINRPMYVIAASADSTAVPKDNADVLNANGNCPKSENTIMGASHSFSTQAHSQLLIKYMLLWMRYHVSHDGTAFDGLYGSGAQADQTAGLITFTYCSGVASIEVTPPTATLSEGATQQFTATLRDAQGNQMNGTSTWSVTGGIGTIDSKGLFTAGTAGSGTVVGASGSVSDSATITVTGNPVASVAVSPAVATIVLGSSQQFVALVKDSAGKEMKNATVTWAATGSAGTVDPNGLFTSTALGSATVKASASGGGGSAEGTATVTVTDQALPPLASATVSPATLTIAIGDTSQFSVVVKDDAGKDVDPSTIVLQWSVSGSAGAIDQSGLFTATAAGSASVKATATRSGKSVEGSAAVTVSGYPIDSVTLSPPAAGLRVGETMQFTALVKDSSGAEVKGVTLDWTTTGDVGTIDKNGLFMATKTGGGSVKARVAGGSVESSATVVVTAAPNAFNDGPGGGFYGSTMFNLMIASIVLVIAVVIATVIFLMRRRRKRRLNAVQSPFGPPAQARAGYQEWGAGQPEQTPYPTDGSGTAPRDW